MYTDGKQCEICAQDNEYLVRKIHLAFIARGKGGRVSNVLDIFRKYPAKIWESRQLGISRHNLTRVFPRAYKATSICWVFNIIFNIFDIILSNFNSFNGSLRRTKKNYKTLRYVNIVNDETKNGVYKRKRTSRTTKCQIFAEKLNSFDRRIQIRYRIRRVRCHWQDAAEFVGKICHIVAKSSRIESALDRYTRRFSPLIRRQAGSYR